MSDRPTLHGQGAVPTFTGSVKGGGMRQSVGAGPMLGDKVSGTPLPIGVGIGLFLCLFLYRFLPNEMVVFHTAPLVFYLLSI